MGKIVTARIDGQTHNDLMAMAKEEDRSVSYLVRKAVEKYLVREISGETSERRSSHADQRKR
ncbi:ribbon-helix-helix protein, CopG family [Candidatus Bathyarchaeota archaeon]|jgi:predicted transcriptional regulator|nr:ribbon-helix-helix protein, CopG family [Candidatus Bathyarchaeota archaeon]